MNPGIDRSKDPSPYGWIVGTFVGLASIGLAVVAAARAQREQYDLPVAGGSADPHDAPAEVQELLDSNV